MVGVSQDSTLLQHQQRYLQARQREKSRYYSLDTTDESTINNTSVYDDHSESNTAPNIDNRRNRGNNINRNTATSNAAEEQRNKYHSKFSMTREKNAGGSKSRTTSFDTIQDDYMRNEEQIEDLSDTTEFLDRNFRPFSDEPPLIQKQDGDVAVAPSTLLQDSSRSTRGTSAFIKTSRSETNLGSPTRTRNSIDHRDSTNTRRSRSVSKSRSSLDYHNNMIEEDEEEDEAEEDEVEEEEQEEEYHDNSFHLGLEPMETDLSSMTDTMYSLNSKYQKYLKKNVTKKTRYFNFDNVEHKHQKRHNVETISETNRQQPIESSVEWLQSVSPIDFDKSQNFETEVVNPSRSTINRNTNTHYDNIPPSNVTNSINQEREPYYVKDGGSFDSAIDTINSIINERKNIKRPVSTSIPKRQKNNPRNSSKYDSKMETPRSSNAKQKQQYQRMSNNATVPSLTQFRRDNPRDVESSSTHTDLLHPSPMRLFKQPPTAYFPASTNGDTRTQSTENFSRAVSQDWATVAVNVAVSILESGESQEIAEAATAAVLSVGGSAMLNKSSALEAAAEASTAALSVGCSQTTAATVAVAVLKASKIIPNRAGNKLEVQKSRSFDSIDSLTEECTITPKARSSSNLSLGKNNLSSNDFTETDYYMNDERDTAGSYYEECEQRATISQRNSREVRSNGSGEDDKDITMEDYSKTNHDTSSSYRTDDDDMYESSTLLTYQSSVVNSHDTYCLERNRRKEHYLLPNLSHAMSSLYSYTKVCINNAVESETYQNLRDGCTEFVFQSSVFSTVSKNDESKSNKRYNCDTLPYTCSSITDDTKGANKFNLCNPALLSFNTGNSVSDELARSKYNKKNGLCADTDITSNTKENITDSKKQHTIAIELVSPKKIKIATSPRKALVSPKIIKIATSPRKNDMEDTSRNTSRKKNGRNHRSKSRSKSRSVSRSNRKPVEDEEHVATATAFLN